MIQCNQQSPYIFNPNFTNANKESAKYVEAIKEVSGYR